MASRNEDGAKELRRIVRRIDTLRKTGAAARSEGRKSIPVRDAFDYEIVQRALELLRETLNSGSILAGE